MLSAKDVVFTLMIATKFAWTLPSQVCLSVSRSKSAPRQNPLLKFPKCFQILLTLIWTGPIMVFQLFALTELPPPVLPVLRLTQLRGVLSTMSSLVMMLTRYRLHQLPLQLILVPLVSRLCLVTIRCVIGILIRIAPGVTPRRATNDAIKVRLIVNIQNTIMR